MNDLHLIYAQVLCLKYKVDLAKIESLTASYYDMYQEVLENSAEVPDTLVRSYTPEEATSDEIRVLVYLLKTLLGFPITMVSHYGAVVLETNMVAPLPSN